MVKDERGAVLIIFVFILMITITIIVAGYGFLIVHEMKASDIELDDQKALYIAETGIERAMVYLENDTDWSNNNGNGVINENFDTGSYNVDLSSGTRTTIVVDSEATVGSGSREVKRKLRQKISRLPEAFNFALFSDTTNSSQIQGTLEINGGDLYARGNITGGTLDVADGGSPSTLSGGLVYSEGSVTSGGSHTVGTTPTYVPPMPVLDTTYYDDIMSGYDTSINTYNTSATYLGHPGPWEVDPNAVVSIVLSGNRYFADLTTKGASSITGSGAIISDGDVNLQKTTAVAPSGGGSILIIARDNLKVTEDTTIGPDTTLYSKDNILRVINDAVVTDATLLSADGIRVLNKAAITNSTLYHSVASDTLNIDGQNVSVTGSTIFSRGGMRILNPDVSDSTLYTTSTADRIHLDGNKTNVDGTILANSTFRLVSQATVTGIVYAAEADLRRGTINGSVVADSFTNNRMVNGGSTVTINYDDPDTYFPNAPAGLGLDIDGDANEEGIIIKVPGTWQQL